MEFMIPTITAICGFVISWLVKPVPQTPQTPPLPPPKNWPLVIGISVTASVLTWIFITNRPSSLHDPTCPRCIESIDKIGLPCGHSFHIDCIRDWFIHRINIERSTMDCPTCRRDIPGHLESEYRQRLNINQNNVM